MHAQARDGGRVGATNGAQQLLGALLQLLERWTRRERRMGHGHTISFRWRPRPPDGLKEDRALSA
jgi:hypothetical protein